MRGNPFEISVVDVVNVVDTETGEMYGLVKESKGGGMFVKLHKADRLVGLSGTGARVFLKVAMKLGFGMSWVDVRGFDMDSSSLYRGVNELVRIGVLAKRSRGTYWVNHLILSNGKGNNTDRK
jgi:hypothetical protein